MSLPKSSACHSPTQHCSVFFSIFGCQFLFIYLFVRRVVLFFEESICEIPVCNRYWKKKKRSPESHWIKAPGSVEHSLKTPLLLFIPPLHYFIQLIPPLWTFLSSSPHFHFCCHGYSLFALIHTFLSLPEMFSFLPSTFAILINSPNKLCLRHCLLFSLHSHSLFCSPAALWLLLPVPMHPFGI